MDNSKRKDILNQSVSERLCLCRLSVDDSLSHKSRSGLELLVEPSECDCDVGADPPFVGVKGGRRDSRYARASSGHCDSSGHACDAPKKIMSYKQEMVGDGNDKSKVSRKNLVP